MVVNTNRPVFLITPCTFKSKFIVMLRSSVKVEQSGEKGVKQLNSMKITSELQFNVSQPLET